MPENLTQVINKQTNQPFQTLNDRTSGFANEANTLSSHSFKPSNSLKHKFIDSKQKLYYTERIQFEERERAHLSLLIKQYWMLTKKNRDYIMFTSNTRGSSYYPTLSCNQREISFNASGKMGLLTF